MQVVRPSSKKRDAETAFSAEHQDLSWSFDDEATQTTESQGGAQNQSALMEQLLKSSRIKTRRTVQKLLDDTQKVFAAVEKDIQPLQAAYQAEMEERLQQLEKSIKESKNITTKPLAISLDQIQQQINRLDRLGQCYADVDLDQTKKLECDLHITQREQHKMKISQRGAQVAQKQMKQATQDVQLRLDTIKFKKAHCDFFKAIQSRQSRA